MEILYLLIPMSIALVFGIGVVFWWSVKSGQFEDLEGPAYRVLMDDDTADAKDDVNEDSISLKKQNRRRL